MKDMKKLTALIIMDGFGLNPAGEGNAVRISGTPNIKRLMEKYPTTQLGASGMDVGLPDGQMGNSEVGHTNIGAGRVVYQELTRITKSIMDGDFYENDKFLAAAAHCKKNDSALHLIGLVSDGGVHSHNTHLYAFLELAKRQGLKKVYIHCLMDGRDVPPDSGKGFIQELCEKIDEIGVGEIATIMGRYYGMDRERRWDRVEKAYAALAYGEGVKNPDPVSVMSNSYLNGATDEFVLPSVVSESGAIKTGDSVIFFNFRPDRARQITRAFVDDEFDGFARKTRPENLYYVCMTQYDAQMPNVQVAYKPQSLDNVFGQIISEMGMKQLRIAEYTKYAHVTFFFNGGVETVYPGEDRVLIDSPDVATYDLKPEMSAYEVTDEVIRRINSGEYDVIILNFANCDMVGHSGVLDAAVAAVNAVDECVGKVVEAILANDGRALITADHGNADQMIDPVSKEPFTAHSTFPVPLILADDENINAQLKSGGRLADLCPTMLDLMGIKKPAEMTGVSLIEK